MDPFIRKFLVCMAAFVLILWLANRPKTTTSPSYDTSSYDEAEKRRRAKADQEWYEQDQRLQAQQRAQQSRQP